MRRALVRTPGRLGQLQRFWDRLRALRMPRPLRALLTAVVDYFPWTPLGTLLSLGAIFGLRHYAYAELDLVWLVLGYAGLALLLLAPLLVVPTALWLRLRWRRPNADVESDGHTLETGRPGVTGFALPTLAWVPLVELTWRWRSPSGARVRILREGGRFVEQVVPGDRGQFSGIVRGVAVGDVFGLCRIWLSQTTESPLRVLPALGRLPRLASLSAYAMGDEQAHPLGLAEGDRLEINRYAPGDPVRFVHWKLLARTRQLLVRRPETALSLAQRVAAYLVAGEADDATAAVARAAVDGGWLGPDFLFGTAEQASGVSTRSAAQELIMRSSAQRHRQAREAAAFFAQADRAGPAAALLFVPPVSGPWLQQVLPLCRARRVRAVVGVDQLLDTEVAPLWRRMWFAPEAVSGHSRAELDRVVRALRAAGCEVVVVDRPNGRLLSETHMRGSRASSAAAKGRAA